MNIAVLVKQIPDPTLPGSLDSNFRFVREGKIVIDEADLYGVEIALRLRDEAGGGQVSVVSMAPNGETAGVRTALAMGADNSIVVSDEALSGSHSLATAKVLSAAIDRLENVDLIIGGTESTDGYSGTVPAQIAALRDVSALTFAISVEINDGEISIKRQSNEGVDSVSAQLPAVVSVTAGVVEPRYPNFKGIMEAKNKPVEILSLSDLSIDAGSLKIDLQNVSSIEDSPSRESGTKIDDETIAADKIIELLDRQGALS